MELSDFWDGKHFWIWELNRSENGSLDVLVNRAVELGLAGLIVKAWDGRHYWSQFDQILAPAKRAGLIVAAWGYSYGNDIPGEIRAMERAVSVGCDWLVIDAEIEYEGDSGRDNAASLLKAVKSSSFKDIVLGYTSFAFPGLHSKFPYDIFSSYCNVALPQVYWGEFRMRPDQALQRSVREMRDYGLSVAPVGQTFGNVTGEQIRVFGDKAEALGLSGVSFWSWQHATAEMMDAVRALSLKKGDPQVSDWAKKAWDKAVAKKVLDGTNPRGTVTREMLAVVLDNLGLLEPVVNAPEALEKLAQKARFNAVHPGREQVDLFLLSVILERLGII